MLPAEPLTTPYLLTIILNALLAWDFTFPKILSQGALERRFCVCTKSHVHDLKQKFPFGKRSPFLIFRPVECVCKYFAKGVTFSHLLTPRRLTGCLSFGFLSSYALLSFSGGGDFNFRLRYFIIAWTNKFFHCGESVRMMEEKLLSQPRAQRGRP